LLSHVATAERPPTLAESARAADLALSTTSRLLRTLETQGYVRRAADGRYWPGTRIFQLGAVAMRALPAFELAVDHLVALADATGETAYLSIPDGDGNALYVRQVESPQSIRHASWLGQSIPLEDTALGVALAGKVDEMGFAVNRGGPIEPDAVTAASPVYDSSTAIVAGLSVIGPSFRIDDSEIDRIGRLVAAHAEELSAELGGAPR
jgi:urocanate hydratase